MAQPNDFYQPPYFRVPSTPWRDILKRYRPQWQEAYRLDREAYLVNPEQERTNRDRVQRDLHRDAHKIVHGSDLKFFTNDEELVSTLH